MNNILEFAVFRRPQTMLETNFIPASDLTPEPSVALVTGGAVLGFDDRVHIDLDRTHTILSPDEARRFAAELKRIADVIDPLLSTANNARWGSIAEPRAYRRRRPPGR